MTHVAPLQSVLATLASPGQATQTLLHVRLGFAQLQLKLPSVLLHIPAPQPPLLVLHSLMSRHAVFALLRANPGLQVKTTHALLAQPVVPMFAPVGQVAQTLPHICAPVAQMQVLFAVLHICPVGH